MFVEKYLTTRREQEMKTELLKENVQHACSDLNNIVKLLNYQFSKELNVKDYIYDSLMSVVNQTLQEIVRNGLICSVVLGL